MPAGWQNVQNILFYRDVTQVYASESWELCSRFLAPEGKKVLATDDPTRKEESESVGSERGYRDVYDRALRILSLRDHGVEELRNKLLVKGEPPDLVEQVLEECLRLRFLDDANFVYRRAVSRIVGKGYGPHKVRGELLAMGLAPEIVAQGLARVLAEIDLGEIVKKIFSKRCSELQKGGTIIKDKRARKRCFDLLFRRGFDMDTINRVLS